jgi:hypothetical protein
MLYLISGASRSGKTLIARRISEQQSISYLSLDWLIMGFTNGIPEYGIHDMLFPYDIAEKFWSFLKSMLENMIYDDVNYIIEGEAIFPELISDLLSTYPDKLKICFVGFTDIDLAAKVKDVKDFSIAKNDWLVDKSDEYIIDHIKNMVAHSVQIKKSCKKNNIKYFDTSKNFPRAIEGAVNYFIHAENL